MNDNNLNQQSNRFSDSNFTETPIQNERNPDNQSESKEIKYIIFLIFVFVLTYWLFAKYYFV
jgi:hypothetical protein